jgi:hypothetical protein
MTVSDAQRAFGRPLVRVSLDWERLESLRAPVRAHVYADKGDLGALVHPWYADARGGETRWDFPDARPVNVAELASRPNLATTHGRRERVDRIAREMSEWQPPLQVTAFGYELPDGKQLILDSNHRVAALAKLAATGTAFRLIVLAVKGPLDGEILPDLMHHARDRRPLAAAVRRAEQRRAVEKHRGTTLAGLR